MRHPTSLCDVEILQDDPLASLFLLRGMQGSSRNAETQITATIVDEVRKAEGGCSAVEAWLSFALFTDDNESPQMQQRKYKADQKNTTLFVEFFWLLHQKQKQAAKLLVEQARIKRGFDFQLPTIRPKRIRRNQPEDIAQQTLDSPTTSGGSSVPVPSTADDSVAERPRKIRRVEVGNSDSRTVTSGLKIIIPAQTRGRLQGTRRVKKAQPPITTEGASQRRSPRKFNEDFQQAFNLSAARKCCVRRHDVPPIASTSKAYVFPTFFSKVDREEPWDPPSNVLSTLAVPSSSSGVCRKYDDEDMVLCDPMPVSSEQGVPCSWPESRTGLPPVWSKSRQEMCETLPWFRSFHGGVYQKGGIAKGYMLSGFGAARDRFEHGGKLIISHGGGGRCKGKNGMLDGTVADQKEGDTSVHALLRIYKEGTPLVLLVDDNYPKFPLNLKEKDIYLTVLGFYRIVAAWAEFEDIEGACVVRYKFAFQWCDGQGEPWWHSRQKESAPATTSHLDLQGVCGICQKTSPHIYTQGWACLNARCALFWTTYCRRLPAQLSYRPEFLALREPPQFPPGFDSSLIPEHPVLASPDIFTTSYQYTRGWHCLKCGRVSSRTAWEKYECAHCQDDQPIIGKVHTAASLRIIPAPNRFVDKTFKIIPSSLITALEPSFFQHAGGTGLCQSFSLPSNSGTIHHVQAKSGLNTEADKILEAYQAQASDGSLLFRRFPLRTHSARGNLMSSYYSQNTGEAYQYVGGSGQTVPFDRAPSAVIDAHRLIIDRIAAACAPKMKREFNEVLSVAYLEQQKMSFHSDNEVGLGPVIAGLSLGSPALMHFRPPEKPADRHNRRTELSILLRHVSSYFPLVLVNEPGEQGDILVMDGVGVQKYYNHTVVSFHAGHVAIALSIHSTTENEGETSFRLESSEIAEHGGPGGMIREAGVHL
ncbi:hypothetical protein C8R44DRAFT_880003 [Mycena epipterygia]|nr:hypothetical protein C8R44DRAFT_880003 [Mycena epipterygia]